ncbi:hypothetical protein CYR40_08505 [Chimaeribacter arupi]|uniref:Uncharacterized protein n=2 Tax=Yersiniaceae TaxID=1903411 RepID=A0A2N5ENL1_9GAMM|nr:MULTISPECIES: hypothetical protein [Yersiniaceae]MBS0969541.1 hypothetical protein [Nissabacter archeti]MDV5140312.1 hypothetical protein [Chimaeribacter arupi]PLR30587.1 hypothetical protein CYR23_17675 [Chimaeribacter arupi]PLR47626.1 hypothetical protein CYR40_08505 [Chimaeribacter arupi]PLR50283.1 hypothetical protein CYR34_10335 [Chimaeribacter arupi]
MTAKDDFFKKMRENVEEERTAIEAVKEDISMFQREIAFLFENIELWFQDSSVRCDRTETFLTAGNAPYARYQVQELRLTNGKKTLFIVPQGLYYFGGAKGCILVSVGNDRSDRKLFELRMQDSRANFENWAIIDHQKPHHVTPFNEENFFRLIYDFS